MTLLLHASRNPLHTWAKRVAAVPGGQLPHLAGIRVRPPTPGAVVAAHLTGFADLVETDETLHNAEHACS